MRWSRRAIQIVQPLTIVLVSLLCFTCETERGLEPQVAFIKYYGGEGNQEAVDVHVNSDGTIILLGTTTNNGSSNIFVVKTDLNGNILQTATFGNGADVARDLEQAADGNYVILARTHGQDFDSVKLIKITPNLDEIGSVMDGFPGKDAIPNTVTALGSSGQNGFIVTGTTNYTTSSNSVQMAMHLRFTENLQIYPNTWETRYGNAQVNVSGIVDIGVRTINLDANRFYVFGYSNVPQGTSTILNFNLWYYGLDSVGTASGSNFIVNASEDFVSESSPSSSQAFGSITTAETAGVKELLFSRYPIYSKTGNGGELKKELGDPINTKLSINNSLRNLEAVKIVAKGSGNGYYVVANEIELDNSRNIWVSSIDEAGNVLWSSNFGAKENDDRGGAVAELPNGRLIVLGTMRLENQDKLALINVNSNGRLTN